LENLAEEKRCVDRVEELIVNHPVRVAGLIVEPIQAEGGDNHASAWFFQQLRRVTKKHNVALIVDEVQTGGGSTGKFWAHQHWNLESPPDIVTFSKKLQAAGFYHNIEFRPNMGYRNFNTWLGDPLRALQLSVIVQQIQLENLLDNVNVTGRYLKDLLHSLSVKYKRMTNVRGQGTFCAFDMTDVFSRDKLINQLRQLGIEVGGCGHRSIRLRPTLVFAPRHALQFAQLLENALQKLA